MSNSSHMRKLAHAALDEVSHGQVMQVVLSCAFVSSAFV
jgi:ABC-type Mn2+/Zn2+ transport system ATPase subunit